MYEVNIGICKSERCSLFVCYQSEPPGIDKWFSSYAYESPPVEEDVILDDDKENMMECCSNGKVIKRADICTDIGNACLLFKRF